MPNSVAIADAFRFITLPDGSTIAADQVGDTLTFQTSGGISITSNLATDTLTFTTASGSGNVFLATGIANSTHYVTFTAADTGEQNVYSDTTLTYNPFTNVLSASYFSGDATNLTNVPAGNLTGTIPSTVLGNSNVYIGTTSIALNRASATLTLNGVSIDGNAATATNATNAGASTTAVTSTNLAGGNNSTLLGSIPYQSNTDITSLLPPNTTTTRKFLRQTGDGTNGAVPSWDTVTATDVGLGNVTNESKATMFTSPTFTTSVDGTTSFTAFASSTTLNIGYSANGTSETYISSGNITSGTRTISLGIGGNTGSSTTIYIGSSQGPSNTYLQGNITLGYNTTSPSITINGHPTIEGVTSTGATGSGKFVFDTTPTFTTSIDGGATFAAFSSSTALTIGPTTSGTITINSGVISSGSRTINIGIGGEAGSTTNVYIGTAQGGTSNIYLQGTARLDNTEVDGNLNVNGGTITAKDAVTNRDAVALQARAGGSSSYVATFTPATLTASRTITVPDATTTIAGTDAVQTLTNKRIDSRVSSVSTTASITPDVSLYDLICVNALAETLTINAPIGTPVDGTRIMFRILDNGVSRTINWNATYTSIGVLLPATTQANKTVYVGCIYNAALTRWDVIVVLPQF